MVQEGEEGVKGLRGDELKIQIEELELIHKEIVPEGSTRRIEGFGKEFYGSIELRIEHAFGVELDQVK